MQSKSEDVGVFPLPWRNFLALDLISMMICGTDGRASWRASASAPLDSIKGVALTSCLGSVMARNGSTATLKGMNTHSFTSVLAETRTTTTISATANITATATTTTTTTSTSSIFYLEQL